MVTIANFPWWKIVRRINKDCFRRMYQSLQKLYQNFWVSGLYKSYWEITLCECYCRIELLIPAIIEWQFKEIHRATSRNNNVNTSSYLVFRKLPGIQSLLILAQHSIDSVHTVSPSKDWNKPKKEHSVQVFDLLSCLIIQSLSQSVGRSVTICLDCLAIYHELHLHKLTMFFSVLRILLDPHWIPPRHLFPPFPSPLSNSRLLLCPDIFHNLFQYR